MWVSKGARKRGVRVLDHQKVAGPDPPFLRAGPAGKARLAGLADRDRALLTLMPRVTHCRARVQPTSGARLPLNRFCRGADRTGGSTAMHPGGRGRRWECRRRAGIP
jgi:hypothetical protein